MTPETFGEADEEEGDASDRDFHVSQEDENLMSSSSTETDSPDDLGGSRSESTESDRDGQGLHRTFVDQSGLRTGSAGIEGEADLDSLLDGLDEELYETDEEEDGDEEDDQYEDTTSSGSGSEADDEGETAERTAIRTEPAVRGQSAQAVAGVATSGDGIAQSYGALGPANSYTGSQDLGAMAAGLFPSDPELLEAPIGIRTRARHPLAGVTIEQLGALDLPEEDILPLSDEEYYQHFLEAVKGNAPDDLLEDEDDDDFVLDWDELLQMGDEGPADVQEDGPPEMLLPKPRGPRTRGRRTGAYIYQPKWLRWNHRERPLESTLRLQTRQLRRLLPAPPRDRGGAPAQAPAMSLPTTTPTPGHIPQCGGTQSAIPPASEAAGLPARPLGEAEEGLAGPDAAAAAGAASGGPLGGSGVRVGHGVSAPAGQGGGSGNAAGAWPFVGAPHVLPGALGSLVTRPPLARAAGNAVLLPAFQWTEEQLGRLHDQVAEHVQLLVECYGMTARDHRYQDLANQAHELIFGLQVFRDTQVARRGSQVHAAIGRRSVIDVPALDLLPAFFVEMNSIPMLTKEEIEATEAARLKARKKRKRQGGADNPFFPKGPLPVMADQIATALRRFGTAFKPHLYVDALPRPRRTNNAASWWASEDELLVQGIKRFGKAPASICLYFLPTKDEKAILSRIKTRCSNRAGENSIKAVRGMSIGPLAPEEVALIDSWLANNGGMARKWEAIARQLLPLRNPYMLGKLYRDAKEGRLPNNNNYRPPEGPINAMLLTHGESIIRTASAPRASSTGANPLMQVSINTETAAGARGAAALLPAVLQDRNSLAKKGLAQEQHPPAGHSQVATTEPVSSNALDQQPPPDHEDGSWDQPDYDDDYGGAGDDTGPSGCGSQQGIASPPSAAKVGPTSYTGLLTAGSPIGPLPQRLQDPQGLQGPAHVARADPQSTQQDGRLWTAVSRSPEQEGGDEEVAEVLCSLFHQAGMGSPRSGVLPSAAATLAEFRSPPGKRGRVGAVPQRRGQKAARPPSGLQGVSKPKRSPRASDALEDPLMGASGPSRRLPAQHEASRLSPKRSKGGFSVFRGKTVQRATMPDVSSDSDAEIERLSTGVTTRSNSSPVTRAQAAIQSSVASPAPTRTSPGQRGRGGMQSIVTSPVRAPARRRGGKASPMPVRQQTRVFRGKTIVAATMPASDSSSDEEEGVANKRAPPLDYRLLAGVAPKRRGPKPGHEHTNARTSHTQAEPSSMAGDGRRVSSNSPGADRASAGVEPVATLSVTSSGCPAPIGSESGTTQPVDASTSQAGPGADRVMVQRMTASTRRTAGQAQLGTTQPVAAGVGQAAAGAEAFATQGVTAASAKSVTQQRGMSSGHEPPARPMPFTTHPATSTGIGPAAAAKPPPRASTPTRRFRGKTFVQAELADSSDSDDQAELTRQRLFGTAREDSRQARAPIPVRATSAGEQTPSRATAVASASAPSVNALTCAAVDAPLALSGYALHALQVGHLEGVREAAQGHGRRNPHVRRALTSDLDNAAASVGPSLADPPHAEELSVGDGHTSGGRSTVSMPAPAPAASGSLWNLSQGVLAMPVPNSQVPARHPPSATSSGPLESAPRSRRAGQGAGPQLLHHSASLPQGVSQGSTAYLAQQHPRPGDAGDAAVRRMGPASSNPPAPRLHAGPGLDSCSGQQMIPQPHGRQVPAVEAEATTATTEGSGGSSGQGGAVSGVAKARVAPVAESDAELVAAGVLTRWTKAEDMAILRATMLEARGQPVEATFLHLVHVLAPVAAPDAGPRTTVTVRSRYEWLRQKMMASGARQ